MASVLLACLGVCGPIVYAQSGDAPDITQRDLEYDYRQRTATGAVGPASEFDVPVLRERNDEVRIRVNKIVFDELPEYPEKGITKEAILDLVERKRREFMREDEILASGFTQAELEEIGTYLAKVSAETQDRSITDQHTADLVDILRRQRAQRGMSLHDLRQVAAAITQYYREHGLFLAQAIIPAQEVDGGVVRLRVLAGVQGDIQVTGTRKYSPERLKQPFERQVGGLVNNRNVEEGLYLLNDYPGLSVYGSFSAGEEVGETTFTIDVRQEKTWQVALRSDNHGSTFTGDNRAYLIADWYNPLGIGDSLNVGFLKSFSPEESDLGQFSYQFPIFGARTKVRIAADHNEFGVANPDDALFDELNLEGTNSAYSLGVNHQFIRGRTRNFNAGLTFTRKETSVETQILGIGDSEKVRGAELNFNMDALVEETRLLNVASVTLQYGDFLSEVEKERGDEFYKLSLNTSSLLFLPLPWTDISTRLVLNSRLQYSESSLPAFEQFVLGGAQGVRAYTVRDFSADQAAYLGAEWYWRLPGFLDREFSNGRRLNDMLQVALFADAARGRQNAFTESEKDQWASLAGWGVLFKFIMDDRFSSELSFARPTLADSTDDGVGEDEKSVRVFADFTFFFD